MSAVVLTDSGSAAATPRVGQSVRMQLEGAVLWPVRGAGDGRALIALAGQRVHALAGIGNPARFF